MQTITRILKTNGVIGIWSDEFGQNMDAPKLTIGTRCRLNFDLRLDEKDPETDKLLPINYNDIRCTSYYIALDSDYLQETDPKLLKTSGFSIERASDGNQYLCCEIPNTAVQSLIDAVDSAKSITLHGEIGGFNSEEDAATFVYQFEIIVHNRVYLGGTVPEEVVASSEYWTKHQVKAYLAQSISMQYSADGTAWHDEQGKNDLYWRWKLGENGEWTLPLTLYQGMPGQDGLNFRPDMIGTLAERPATAAVNTCYFATDKQLCYWFSGSEWTGGVPLGPQGKNVYELAVEKGFDGTIEEFIASLKGQPGQNMKYDATGELSELAAYDNERAGFIFAGSDTDPRARISRLYIYAKRTDDIGDWCSPAIIAYYSKDGKDGANIALVPPLEFKAPTDDSDYLYFNITDHQTATIAAVCIDTEEGEYRLPYDSALGIRRIIKDEKNVVRVYFGAHCPTFETGRIYFAQGVSGLTQYQWYLENGGTLPFADWCANKGIVSIEKIDSEGLVDTYEITYTNNSKQEYTIVNGKSAYDVAVENGFKGTAKEFLKSLKGEDGRGVNVDIAGLFSERHVYDSAERGFRYLATDILIDEENGSKYQVYYQKKSNDQADWSDGIIMSMGARGDQGDQGDQGEKGDQGERGPRGENADVIPDIEFTAEDVFGGSLKIDGVKPIAAVELYDIAGNGEVIERGKSVKEIFIQTCYPEDHTLVYFGAELDFSRGGRVRFAQGIAAKSPYQIWLEAGYEGNEEDYLNWIRGGSNEYVFGNSEVTDRKLLIAGDARVFAVVDETGRQYPFALDEVVYGKESTTIDLSAIMMYRNLDAIPGTWSILFSIGANGKPGTNFAPDETGTLADRSQYDDSRKGFAFLDTNTGMIYHKKSFDLGDWSTGFSLRGDKGDTGAIGPQGLKGDKGDTGTTGATGGTGTISIGTVTTGAAGTSASVTNVGTATATRLNFTIPKGDKGDTGATGNAATIAIGTVTTGAAGTSASATNSGTSGAAVLNFTIPRGATGATGTTGTQGAKGDTGTAATVSVGTVTTGATGTSAIVTNSGTSGAAVLNFTIPRGATGVTGAQGPKGDTGATGATGSQGPIGQISVIRSATRPSVPENGTIWIKLS